MHTDVPNSSDTEIEADLMFYNGDGRYLWDKGTAATTISYFSAYKTKDVAIFLIKRETSNTLKAFGQNWHSA